MKRQRSLLGAIGLGMVLVVGALGGPAMGASDEPGADEPIDGVPAVALVAAGDLDPESPVGCLLQQSASPVQRAN
ncbi:hypothetical protein GCM10011608_58820 [Micromonospora sonchi]|uniref:Uncharacterized protein n=1 Tax=Micromonospora sonchi TaxID=1763543 RepID=A0A917X558_9ACTN|nr:hypothetical protein GCM10011608_58820 [Micromonospora sonchi]